MAAARAPSCATSFGAYEILFRLATGGMAELLLARVVDPEAGERLVVVKKILPDYAKHPRFVKLFLDEAKLVGTLDHPNIAQVYDQGTVDGNHFFAMEYVHGKDVRSTLQRTMLRGRMFPLGPAVHLARVVAAALHYAHERRQLDGRSFDIVHRDVSPSNILISYEGDVKLVDFGIAKAASSSVKTKTGMLKGKIAYMSPEQARGDTIDRRSDLFSLGIVLWEMIAMRRLFLADNDLATIQRIINVRPAPPSQLRTDCPRRLDEIVLKALAADCDARYQTAAELACDLEELAAEAELVGTSHALRAHMQRVFEPEIAAWKEAHEAGTTLTDYMIANGVEATVSVPDDELLPIDELEDEDDDDATAFYSGRTPPQPFSAVARPPSHPALQDVTSYPSIDSDPSYMRISRDRHGERSASRPPRRDLVRVVVIAIAAIAVGIATALMGS